MTPADYAQQVISEFNITTTPALSLNEIFESNDILCISQEFDDFNYCGSLHRNGQQAVIIVNTDIKNDGRINFTKTHEFGHFYLKHKGVSFTCRSQDLKLNHSLSKPFEVEANQFASAFLMPESMVKPIIQTSPFNFDTIGYIRKHFVVSKLSAAFKILDYTFGDYALIVSRNGIITHVKLSESLNGKIHLPQPNEIIPEESLAHEVLDTSRQMNDYSEISSDVWIRSKGYRVFEHSRADKKSNSCMTLLNFIEI